MGENLQLTLEDLADCCAEETQNFLNGKPAEDPHYCYELLHRAFVERGEQSWTLVYEQYHTQVRSWVRRHPAHAACREDEDYLVNRVFDRLWTALTPDKFVRMKDTGSVMRYMQLCVHSVLIDHLRAESPESYLDQDDDELETSTPDTASERAVEQTVFNEIDQVGLWALVQKQLKDKREELVVTASFMWSLAPRDICKRYPGDFESIDDVYRIKENVLARLRRNEELRSFLEVSG
jgi:hypothetical protein